MKRTRLRRRSGLKKRGKRAGSTKELDKLWSRVVRQRGAWKCIVPGCDKPPQGSHIYPKGSYPALRHDPENGFPCCYAHHIHGWHKDPQVQEEIWTLLEQQRGPGFRDRMRLRSQTASRPDKAGIMLVLKRELGE